MNGAPGDIETNIARLKDPEAAASALSALVELAGTKAMRERIDALLSDRKQLYALLCADAPKVRKNTARLIGALARERDAAALFAALFSEDTLFVTPSILLALGSVGGDGARAAVRAYSAPVPADETQQKHCREIAVARDKAASRLSADEPLPVYALDRPREVLLVAPEGFSATLCEELAGLGYAPRGVAKGALVTVSDLAPLFRARCFQQLLLPVAANVPLDPGEIAAVAAPELTLPWRVELAGYEGDRRAFIETLVASLPKGNAPSHYALELRVECKGPRCDVFLRPASVPDARFAYRKKVLPASIAPATAACLARLAMDTWRMMRADGVPAAFDPFCGSATLLIELSKYVPGAQLFGTDVKLAALDAARENCLAAGVRARFIQKDCTRFVPKSPFDIIVSNMPFGNRVGTHDNNEALYRALVHSLPSFLNDGGVAVLYTAEYRLMQACVGREKRLVETASLRTEAGGLLPWVFVLQKRG